MHPIEWEYGLTMAQKLKRIAIIVIGWVFLLLGIAGLFLPILQGVLFILIGLMILSTEYVWAHHLLSKLKARFPSSAHAADSAVAEGECLDEAHLWSTGQRIDSPGSRCYPQTIASCLSPPIRRVLFWLPAS